LEAARVVLVDDDVSIRRLVTMALAELPIELVVCASGAEALEALRLAPAQLLITDLMMPGMSGFELLQRLAAEPSLRGSARLAVFSAGLNAEAQAQLAGLGVWREISKPVSVLALAATVEEALAEGTAPQAPVGPAPEAAAADATPSDEAQAIRTHFAGNAELFHAFKAGCLLQFHEDLHQLQAALDRRDAGALQRLGHSLKSVLRTLGFAQAASHARALEVAAAGLDWAAGAAHGSALRLALESLALPAPPARPPGG
jgi:CheY-like chemotaxis protein